MSELTFQDKHDIFLRGTPETIKSKFDSNLLTEDDIYLGFRFTCYDNLNNAKWLYANYQDICNGHFTTETFARDLAMQGRKETLIWLKELNNPIINEEVNCFIQKYTFEKHVFESFKEIFSDIYTKFTDSITYVPESLETTFTAKFIGESIQNNNNQSLLLSDIFFNELCRSGNSESIKTFLESNKIDEQTIGTGFDNGCAFNLDNAKWLYNNYTEACNKYIGMTCFFAKDLVSHNKLEALLWLKSIHNELFISQIDLLFSLLINEKCIESNEFKLLYEHFFDRFEYLKSKAINK